MRERVRITEVGPRDGLQNESGVISTADKARMVELCALSGVDEVEVTSFVSAKWVPQLGDAAEVFDALVPFLAKCWLHASNLTCSALVPNVKGMEALEATDHRLIELVEQYVPNDKRELYEWQVPPVFIGKASVFTAASESFAKRNINASIAESIERFRPIADRSRPYRRAVRGYISCAIACPFEGPIHPMRVLEVARQLEAIGVDEIDIGDTIGAADVASTVHLLETLRKGLKHIWFEDFNLTLHLHDTFGHAAECVQAALDLGVRSFDSSVAGLGGCPYASTPGKRAPGNISTRTLVETVHHAGFDTGVDLDALARAEAHAMAVVSAARQAAGGSGG